MIRYLMPTIESFERPIADDDFQIEMSNDAEEKQLAVVARASKLWRTLRVASKSKLNLFDKIDDGNNLKALFEPEGEENRDKSEINGAEQYSDPAAKENSDPVMKESARLIEDEKPTEISGVEATKETILK